MFEFLSVLFGFPSLYDMCLREPLLLNCCFQLCRGGVKPMDLVSVTTSPAPSQNGRPGLPRRMFSFLSVAWGFVSDVDIESERYRGLGSARFTLGTLVRLASLRSYKGRLSYLPPSIVATSPDAIPPPLRRPLSRSITEGLEGFCHTPIQRTSSDMGLSEQRSLRKKLTHWTSPGREPSPYPLPSDTLLSPSSPNLWTRTHPAPDPYPSSTTPTPTPYPLNSPPCPSPSLPRPLPPRPAPPLTPLPTSDDLLPPLDQALPTRDWVTIEGDFVLVLAIYQSHLGADLHAAPQARFDDGLIHLTFVRAGISRATLLRLFLAMERGAHLSLSSPYVSHVPARAFRLQPLSPRGTLTVDGELVPYGPLQAQVHPSMSRLIVGDSGVKITRF
ncbi:unnamed protein product [Oncorhynchus mykiss]|uniref:YegS/DAGK C-terminal domain-containing protein n=1 Tax=Oncorhynchus mykiss TaxID=8022 RepID=A0A060Y9I7_ONCMY|nr:unnamed protein product [Oncorhynchus mykiss]